MSATQNYPNSAHRNSGMGIVELKVVQMLLIITSGFATSYVVVSVRHPITY